MDVEGSGRTLGVRLRVRTFMSASSSGWSRRVGSVVDRLSKDEDYMFVIWCRRT